MRDILATNHLTYSYPNQQRISFPDVSLEQGGEMLITGNSGKGKTTLLHLLGGLLVPATGTVKVKDADFGSMPSGKKDRFRAENIGMVLQQSYFVESISVFENICLASWLASGKRNEKHAAEILETLGLSEFSSKLPSRLSVGQQQRASIARALVNRPAILLADEPTSSLDDENAIKVASLLREASSQTGTALVIVTHDGRLKSQFKNQIAL